jgi:hypothetical protein
VNALVSDVLDPTSRMPAFKSCPVALERAAAEPDRPNGTAVVPPRMSEKPRRQAGLLGEDAAART